MGAERLDERGRARIAAGLAAGDRFDEVGAPGRPRSCCGACTPLATSLRPAEPWWRSTDGAPTSTSPRSKTIAAWEAEVLAYHTTGLSNGPTEAVNLFIAKVRRIGHGFRNFDNHRLRLLLRCGAAWHTRPAARIRGRQPRLVA
ncbi:MAG: transposase [Chloroflexota bacterium]|nr:transposase [Chloroflexota bacterium]